MRAWGRAQGQGDENETEDKESECLVKIAGGVEGDFAIDLRGFTARRALFANLLVQSRKSFFEGFRIVFGGFQSFQKLETIDSPSPRIFEEKSGEDGIAGGEPLEIHLRVESLCRVAGGGGKSCRALASPATGRMRPRTSSHFPRDASARARVMKAGSVWPR